MRQSCLCQYVGATCKHDADFLQLPLAVRERIYLYAGVITGRRVFSSRWPDNGDADTRVLLDVCPQVNREVKALILRHNTLICTEDGIAKAFYAIRSMEPKLCASLRDVYFHVRGLNTIRMGSGRPMHLRRLRDWQSTARHMLKHAAPGQLRVHVICDVFEDMALAREVLAPFNEFPGLLKELELCLSSTRDRDLTKLLSEVVIRAQAPSNDGQIGYFPFFKLPPEIRRLIFSYTGLVLPYRNALWLPDPLGFHRQHVFCECDGTVCREADIHYNARLYHCPARQYGQGEFCSKWYGVYSSRCKHDAVLGLLLANRAMHDEALSYFFANNRITITAHRYPEHIMPSVDPQPILVFGNPGVVSLWGGMHGSSQLRDRSARDILRLFIEKVGIAALPHLREIEIVIPQITEPFNFTKRNQEHREWREAVDLLAKYCHLPGLTIMIYIFTTSRNDPPTRISEATALRQVEGQRILSPMRKLPKLGRLFVYLEWPHHWSSERPRRDIKRSGLPRRSGPSCGVGKHMIPRRNRSLVSQETWFEKFVMGEEYNSYAVGKADVLPSPWLRSNWDQSR